MARVTIVVNEGNSSIKAWNGLRLAAAIKGEGAGVTVFLLDDGVLLAKKGQAPVDGLRELDGSKRLSDLIQMGVKVGACGVCARLKGLSDDELIEGVEVGSMVDLSKAVLASDQVLVF